MLDGCPFNSLYVSVSFVWGWVFSQVILSETANRIFLAESGRKILSALIIKARKVNLLCWKVFNCVFGCND